MRARLRGTILGLAALTLVGCASAEEWQEWRSRPAHFASGQHMVFSVKNREGAPAQVSRADVALARNEAWWGRAVTVDQAQIIER